MNNKERIGDFEEALRSGMDAVQARLWTALPGIIQEIDATALTASVQPAIQGSLTLPDGTEVPVALPLLLDVPLVFPRGGGYVLTFPVKLGDECLVVFSSRCIDAWWQAGGIQPPVSSRMHDLSDGFALVGPYSQATRITDLTLDATRLRTEAGETYVEVRGQEITLSAPLRVVLSSPLVEVQGRIVQTGEQADGASAFTGGFTNTGGVIQSNGITLETHRHTDVQPGGGETGMPV